MLMVFAGPALSARAGDFQMPKIKEPGFHAAVMNLADSGGVGDGRTLNTGAIDRALASLAAKGGGTLVIPPGIWLTGPIHLRSNIDLHLEAGSLLQFTSDFRQYPLIVVDVKGEKDVQSTSPISGENLENIAITGRGVIDGAGAAWRPLKKSKVTEAEWKAQMATGFVDASGSTWWPSREASEGGRLVRQLLTRKSFNLGDYEPAHQFLRPKLLKLLNCRRILLEGVTFQNSPNWTLNPTLCEDLTIRGVTSRNPDFGQNTDALDVESCRNVIIRDSTFDVGDDGICLKSGLDAAGRRIGVPTENVWIDGCAVYHAHGGFTIGSEMSGGVRNIHVNDCLFMGTDIGLRFKSTRGRGGIVEKIYISNVRMTDILGDAINFNMYYGGRPPLDAKGELKEGEQEKVAVDEGTPQFRDIHIENIVCRGARNAVVLQGLPEMPIRDIWLRNVSITSQDGMMWMDAADIHCDNVDIINSRGPVLTVYDTKDAVIDHLTYPAGAEALVKSQGNANRDIAFKNTDIKAAAKDFLLINGATAEAFHVE
ncbi:MAG TPA: glycoside hydrolase family 28 protein [Verrucomicrobiae bacterium]|nr:glycoside hydrolase family 28 protein [Verrucomicrobiae bacterium]